MSSKFENYILINDKILERDSKLISMSLQSQCPVTPKMKSLYAGLIPDQFKLPITKIQDQGPVGSCTGFAAVACMESLFASIAEVQIDLSEQYSYSQNKLNDQWPGTNYSGSSIISAAEVCKKLGICHEVLCKYINKEFVSPTDAMVEDGLKRRCEEIYYIDCNSTLDIKTAIYQGMPILLGIKMFTNFYTPYLGRIKELGKIKSGGHALMAYGYDKDGVYIKNSWGLDYGEDGTVHIAWDVFHEVCSATIAIKGLKEPFDVSIPKLKKGSWFWNVLRRLFS